MMPLDRIDALAALVTTGWTCPVADEVAARWGCTPGTAQWWRSSACHVFVLPGGRYLRFVPAAVRVLDRPALLMNALHHAGSPVVRPVPSAGGNLVELVETSLEPMSAMMVEAAPGRQLSMEDLSWDRASAWGGALARIHLAAADLPWPDEERFTGVTLPDGPDRFGLIHGDFELDNLGWDGDRPTAYDFDEATRSWYAADVAYALRDAFDESRDDLVDAFLGGYREIRPFDDLDQAWLPRFRSLNAARSASAIEQLLNDDPRPDDHRELYDKLRAYVERQRSPGTIRPDS